MFIKKDNYLAYRYDAEHLWIQPWGKDAFRIRATKMSAMPTEDWALQEPAVTTPEITISDKEANSGVSFDGDQFAEKGGAVEDIKGLESDYSEDDEDEANLMESKTGHF